MLIQHMVPRYCVCLRCAILSLSPRLCRCHVFIVAITALPILIAVDIATILNELTLYVVSGFMHRLRCWRLWNATAIEVVGIEILKVVRILVVVFSY